MTISYSGNFFKLLIRWKGGIWQAVWLELLIFLILYFILSLIYRFALNTGQRHTFEMVALTFDHYTENIPITFLLGFYIAAVVKRWWEQFQFLAWPEDVLTYVNMIFPGTTKEAVQKRRNIARWLNLTTALAWREVSVTVRKRFPTVQHLVSAGLMNEVEFIAYNKLSCSAAKWFLPTQWIQRVVERELKTPNPERSASPPVIAHFIRELNEFRLSFRKLYCYDWVCIPLVYTQVAAIATYGFFVLCIIGRQCLDVTKNYETHKVDIYVPVFTILQFIFYIGWFKVGQYLMRPFEEDDDDLEMNYLLDRHFETSFAVVDEIYNCEPPEPDYPDGVLAPHQKTFLPYTKVSAKEKQHPPKLHAYIKLKKYSDQELVETIQNRSKSKNIRFF